MLCQNCGKNEATTHVKQIINGDMSESYLCRDCSYHLGYSDVFTGFGLNISQLFGGLFGDIVPSLQAENVKKCPKCGTTVGEIMREGRVGCAECYEAFYDELIPVIEKIHGKTRHTGKTGTERVKPVVIESKEDKILKLREKMNDAVSKQEFEMAAQLRDEIKALEGGDN